MDPQFWQDRWASNQIGFHEGKTNVLLEKHFARLSLAPGARVFVPLCGKTRDIAWLLGHGFAVAGAELSPIAVKQLFAELGVEPAISQAGPMTHYAAPSLDIFQGDIFDLSRATLGPVDAIYDRAALVALPKPMRARYVPHLMEVTGATPQLLLCLDYDQSLADGPPFALGDDEVRALYGAAYKLSLLESRPAPGGIRGICPATEKAWLLEPDRS